MADFAADNADSEWAGERALVGEIDLILTFCLGLFDVGRFVMEARLLSIPSSASSSASSKLRSTLLCSPKMLAVASASSNTKLTSSRRVWWCKSASSLAAAMLAWLSFSHFSLSSSCSIPWIKKSLFKELTINPEEHETDVNSKTTNVRHN